MNVLYLLKEHGEMNFEELADIIGSGMDYIDLEMKLQRLAEEGKIKVRIGDEDVRLFSIA